MLYKMVEEEEKEKGDLGGGEELWQEKWLKSYENILLL